MKLTDQGFFLFMRSKSELEDLVKDLFADDIDYLLTYLPSLKDKKNSNDRIIKREKTDYRCPYCNSSRYVKNGHTKEGRQKYHCLSCNKNFSDTNNSIVFKSHSNFSKWIKFIDYELHNYSLRDEASKLDINLATAFSYRHKLYSAISNVKKNIFLKGTVQIDAKIFPINLKGTKPNNMPRISKKRSSSAYRGISHHKVSVLSVVDDNDNMMFEIANIGKEEIDSLEKYNHKFKDINVVVSDSLFCYDSFCKRHGYKHEIVKSKTYKNENGYTLNDINGLHSELEKFLKPKRGVSTKHLQGYLDMFLFMKMLRYTVERDAQVIATYNKLIPTETKKYIRDILLEAMPIDLKKAYGEYKYGIFSENEKE